MTALRVGVDMDGVLYDFIAAMREWYVIQRRATRDMMPAPTQWHVADVWPHLAGDRDRFWRDCQEAFACRHLFLWGAAVDGAALMMHYLAVRGYEVHVVTARDFGLGPELAYDLSYEWLQRERMPFTSLTISSDKASVPTDVFIDDRPENIERVLAAGTLGVMRSQPWNTDRTDLPTAYSLEQFLDVTDSVNTIKELCNV